MNLKVLHRIYFGFDGKPDPYLEYLKTWEEKLPEYKIMHWNAGNLPIDNCEYSRDLFKEKDHAYLSDYFRWWVLREHGGIYLDADIEIVNGELFQSLVEDLEQTNDYHSFIGVETYEYLTYTAHSMACKKNAPLAEYMCTVYENMGDFKYWRKAHYFTAPWLVHFYFLKHGYNTVTYKDFLKTGFISVIGTPEIHAGVKIYPKDYFSPLSIISKESRNGKMENIWYAKDHTGNTCICHHFSNSHVENRTPIDERQDVVYDDYLKHHNDIVKKYGPRISIRILRKLKSGIKKILKKVLG